MTHDEMIEVIKAHKEGKQLQIRPWRSGKWTDLPKGEAPQWNFYSIDYRVKREPRVVYIRIDERGHVGSTSFAKAVIEKFHRLNGGEIVKFVEVMED